MEIIIVDSGSTDATLSIASRYPVKILSIKPEEFSFGHSLNLGCAEASREFIVIASAHVYPAVKGPVIFPRDPFTVMTHGDKRDDTVICQLFRQYDCLARSMMFIVDSSLLFFSFSLTSFCSDETVGIVKAVS